MNAKHRSFFAILSSFKSSGAPPVSLETYLFAYLLVPLCHISTLNNRLVCCTILSENKSTSVERHHSTNHTDLCGFFFIYNEFGQEHITTWYVLKYGIKQFIF